MPPVMLVIMDGVGINPRTDHNAVALAKKPYIDSLWRDFPMTSIKTSSEDVGLPAGVMGNSEVGHLNIGAGRIVYQTLTLINKQIRENVFPSNKEIITVLDGVGSGTLHLMGLLSTGGVHGDIHHVEAILESCAQRGVKRVLIHCFMDGRDMPPRSGIDLVLQLEEAIRRIGVGRIATVSGRYYAMDRDKRWERTKRAYDVLMGVAVSGGGQNAVSAEEAMRAAYAKNITDEFVDPVLITGSTSDSSNGLTGDSTEVSAVDRGARGDSGIKEGDSVFFWNFRPDRARQITRALMDPDFSGFARPSMPKLRYLGMVQYDEAFPLPIAYPPQNLDKVLAQVLAESDRKQFHTAETEKYAHVTFFLNGGVEEIKPGEVRKMIPSPKVATYDLQPEMSAAGVTQGVLDAIASDQYDFIIVNYANGDMVGHTGVLDAAIKAVEAVDVALSQIVPAILAKGGAAIVTADHGNAEQMIWYETGEPHTQHTTFDVTLTICGAGVVTLRAGGRLADIAPTILSLMKIPQPAEMTGESLITRRRD